jgi:hypothetical protein
VLLSAISAAVSLIVARMGEDPSSAGSDDDEFADTGRSLPDQTAFPMDSRSRPKYPEEVSPN